MSGWEALAVALHAESAARAEKFFNSPEVENGLRSDPEQLAMAFAFGLFDNKELNDSEIALRLQIPETEVEPLIARVLSILQEGYRWWSAKVSA